ncbi:MAG: hypothetical protein D6748_08765 [Calditrichaeota bacterium]|nr:MAG: hypothetical protein D6748_08765 [Calditrichota bacterium]
MKRFFTRVALFGAIGGLLGFGYYYFIGCNSGTCPITSNPYISTIYGFVMGAVLGWGGKQNSQNTQQENERGKAG